MRQEEFKPPTPVWTEALRDLLESLPRERDQSLRDHEEKIAMQDFTQTPLHERVRRDIIRRLRYVSEAKLAAIAEAMGAEEDDFMFEEIGEEVFIDRSGGK
jgi:hypothetical protein